MKNKETLYMIRSGRIEMNSMLCSVVAAYREYNRTVRAGYKGNAVIFRNCTREINACSRALLTGYVDAYLLEGIALHYKVFCTVSDETLGHMLTNKHAMRWVRALERLDIERATKYWDMLQTIYAWR